MQRKKDYGCHATQNLGLRLRESHHNAEVRHPHGREAIQANVGHDLNNVALVGVDADKVEGQDCVNRSRERLELIFKHHLPGIVNDTHLARQVVNLIENQFAQGRLSRDTAPRLHDAARDRPLQADIHRTHRRYKRKSSVGAEMLAATAEKLQLSLVCKNFIAMLQRHIHQMSECEQNVNRM